MTYRSDERRRALYSDGEVKQSMAEREIQRLTSKLADCYRATGADTDGNEDWRLAEMAVNEVRRLRSEFDAEQPKFGRSPIQDVQEHLRQFDTLALLRRIVVAHDTDDDVDLLAGIRQARKQTGMKLADDVEDAIERETMQVNGYTDDGEPAQ